MNHKNGFNPLSRTTAHRRAMSRNMVTSLFRFERITTTQSKALEVRKAAEKLITRSKVDTVHNRREVAKYIQDDKILNKLFTEIGPRMKDRKGGYTRILKMGFRQGDAADMVILELVDYKLDTEAEAKKAEKKAQKSAPAAETATEEKKEAPKAAEKAVKPASKAKAAKKEPAAEKAPAKAKKAPAAKSEKAKAPKSAKKADKDAGKKE